jgi:hypothetical protein
MKTFRFLVFITVLRVAVVPTPAVESTDPTGLRYDTTRAFAVELPAGAPTGEANSSVGMGNHNRNLLFSPIEIWRTTAPIGVGH